MGYPLQHSWASLVAQLVKNLPAMRETWVQSLGWEDLLEKGIPLGNSVDCIVHGVAKRWTRLSKFHYCEKVPGHGRSPGGGHGNPL